MALWTPYAQEAALDLSKPAVKVETTSPLPASCAPQSPLPSGPYQSYTESRYHAPYPYQPSSYLYQPVQHLYQPVSHLYQPVPHQYQPVPHLYQPVSYPVQPSTSPDSISICSHSKPPSSSPPESAGFYDSLSDDEDYQKFEKDALQMMALKNGGSLVGNNPRMRRAVETRQTDDDSYRKQRERNNYAAKQSRDKRKLRELRMGLQVSYLKKKMADLRAKLSAGVCGRCGQIY